MSTCPPNCIKGTPLWSLYDVTENNPAYCMYESVVGEYTDIAGFPVQYYRAKSKMDRLYGEDANQNYHDPVTTKLYYEPSDEPNMIDMMGIRSDETLEYSLIPKSTFSRDIGAVISGVPQTIGGAIGGTGYLTKNQVSTTGGTGTGLVVDITTSNGSVTSIKLDSFNKGSGYVIGDTITIVGGDSNASFIISTTTTSDITPMAGDVIKTLWNNRNYEIADVGAEQSIFMAKKLVWEFILRPYRYSEQSLMAEQIHTGKVGWTQIHISPDGLTADLIYANGDEMTYVPVSTLDIDVGSLDCGSTYKKNDDGSYDLLETEVYVEDDKDPHPTYEDTGIPLEDRSTDTYGDNDWVEVESDYIDNTDLDNILFR